MAVEVLADTRHGKAALYCNTSDHAFGPVFGKRLPLERDEIRKGVQVGARQHARAFVRWCYDHKDTDPRRVDDWAEVRKDWMVWLEDKEQELADDGMESRGIATWVMEELA